MKKLTIKRAGRCQPDGTCGALPPCAPLAVPYVPVQPEHPPRYEAPRGLVRGTLFPGLELPFCGMVSDRCSPDTLRSRIQAVSFAVLELGLYLDTHRDDAQALELYRSYQTLLLQLRQQALPENGPTSHQTPDQGPYRWLDDPWPWEYCANGEE